MDKIEKMEVEGFCLRSIELVRGSRMYLLLKRKLESEI